MAAETRKSRKSNFSQEEIDVLITTVMQNQNILYGETSKSYFHKEIRNQVWNIILEEVNKVSLERRTLNEVKNKWKKCQYNLRAVDHMERTGYGETDDLGYEPTFKKTVILFAEQKGNIEARKRYGISEETIKRWRKLKTEILELAKQCVRRSQRHTYSSSMSAASTSSTSSSHGANESAILKKEKEKCSEDKAAEARTKADLDSMPLQQRLSQNHSETSPPTPTQEPVLQSQPISPTKLKVTRQGAKPHQQPPPRAPTPPPPNPEVCLRWNSHHSNMQSAFPNLLMKEQYVDATLVSEGKTLKCHRMILSACSPYFEEVLNGISPFQHPVLFMKDVPFWILKALCDFMYAGEVHILQDKLQEILNIAETLKIKGLAGSSDIKEEVKPIIPEIKQEVDASPVPKIPERPPKEEREEEPPPTPKPTKHETSKPSKRKEDKKSKHSGLGPKEKEKEMPVEEVPPPKVAPKVISKVVIPKVAAKVTVPKVVVPKIQPTPKSTHGKNVVKNVMQKVSRPSTSKAAQSSKKSDSSKKSEKNKVEVSAPKEKEKEKEKPPLKKGNINDPLDLLQPVYEEIAKEDPPPVMKCINPRINPVRLKERGNVPVKRGINKKVKKRRYAEYAEEREESPPPTFSSRKGTRSRPHVKFPKFYHTHYEEPQKETTEATIVREPHTDQSDPLIGVEVEEIKAEPLDVEENTIEMEDNLVNFMQDQEMPTQEDEEIIGNYDSPIVNIKKEIIKRNTPEIFQKILDSEPVIVNVHTVTEGQEGVRLVDISAISTGHNQLEETIVGSSSFDPIESTQEKTSQIVISNIQSMAELCPENRIKDNTARPGECEERSQEGDTTTDESYPQEIGAKPGGKITEVMQENSILFPQSTDCEAITRGEDLPRTDCDPLDSHSADPKTSKETSTVEVRLVGSETETASNVEPANGSLGSLEDKVGDFCIQSQEKEEAVVENVGDFCSQSQEKEETVLEKVGDVCIPSKEKEEAVMERVEDFCIQSQEKEDAVMASGSLGSLEANVEAMEIECQDLRDEESVQRLEESIPKTEKEIIRDQDVERESRLDENEAEKCIGAEERQLAQNDYLPSLHVEKIQKTLLESDVATERVVFQVVAPDAITAEVNEVLNKDVEEDNHQEYIDEYKQELLHNTQETQQIESKEIMSVIPISKELLPVEAASQEKDSVGTDNLEGASLGLVSVGTVDHEMMSVSTASQEMMSIGTASQELMSIGTASEGIMSEMTGSQEIIAKESDGAIKELEASERNLKDIQEGGTILSNQKTEELLGELEAVEKIDNISLPFQKEKDTSTYNQYNDTASDVELPYSGSLDVEERIVENKLLPHKEEIEEIHEGEILPIKIMTVDNESKVEQGLLNITDCKTQAESIAQIDSSGLTENYSALPEHQKIVSTETTENIEAELEQCLASTSDIVPIKLAEEKFKLSTSRLSFDDDDDDEDFTKDIEFDNCIGRNRPANYLGDTFEDDFNMEDVESDTGYECNEVENTEACDDNKKNNSERRDASREVGGNGDFREVSHEHRLQSEMEAEYNCDRDEVIGDDKVAISTKVEDGSLVESKEVLCDRVFASKDSSNINENTEKKNQHMEEKIHALPTPQENVKELSPTEESTSLRGENQDEERNQDMEEVIHTLPPPEENVTGLSPIEANISVRTENQDDIPKTTETFEENRDSMEEDRLLAEDDDIEMENVSEGSVTEETAEKTLEMIVNDLNESLGESRK